jgi:hypothetical protein
VKIELNIDDGLAQEAKAAGLLSELRLETMIRAELALRRKADFFQLAERLHAVPGEPMSIDEICDEVRAVRRERRDREAKAVADRR